MYRLFEAHSFALSAQLPSRFRQESAGRPQWEAGARPKRNGPHHPIECACGKADISETPSRRNDGGRCHRRGSFA